MNVNKGIDREVLLEDRIDIEECEPLMVRGITEPTLLGSI